MLSRVIVLKNFKSPGAWQQLLMLHTVEVVYFLSEFFFDQNSNKNGGKNGPIVCIIMAQCVWYWMFYLSRK